MMEADTSGTLYSTAIQNCGCPETLTGMAKMDRATEIDAMQAKVLTDDEARRVAARIAKLPELAGQKE